MNFIHNPISVTPLQRKEVFGTRHYTDGIMKYPSITTILGKTADKTYLKEWENRLGHANAKKETQRCADRGTELHALCEQYLNNIDFETKNKLFTQLRPHLRKLNNIIMQETALKSDYLKIAGTVDCIAEFNGILSVIDYKSSNNAKTEDMIFDYFLQATFYALAFFEETGIMIENIVIFIAVEGKSMPQIYKKSIIPYIKPLKERIALYYEKHPSK